MRALNHGHILGLNSPLGFKKYVAYTTIQLQIPNVWWALSPSAFSSYTYRTTESKRYNMTSLKASKSVLCFFIMIILFNVGCLHTHTHTHTDSSLVWFIYFGVNSNPTQMQIKNNRTETSLKRWPRSAYKQTLVRFVWTWSDPSAASIAHCWTKPAPVTCSTVH